MHKRVECNPDGSLLQRLMLESRTVFAASRQFRQGTGQASGFPKCMIESLHLLGQTGPAFVDLSALERIWRNLVTTGHHLCESQGLVSRALV